MTYEPTPDLFDICVVLNEATDAPLGADLLPYAARIKAIVIEHLAGEADADGEEFEFWDGEDYVGTYGDDVADWLRAHLPPDPPP